MRFFLIIFLLVLSFRSIGQQKKTQILLIGTFHFNNPGHDAIREPDYDILSSKSQQELELISDKIKAFHPTQFFVEWPGQEQQELDSLYNLYLKGKYFSQLDKQARSYKFYSQNEIFQLAFRASGKAHVKRVMGVDYQNAVFPYDSLMSAIKESGQTELLEWNKFYLQRGKEPANENLSQKLLWLNTEENRRSNRGWYVTFANRGGSDKTYVGAYLTSEWYKRNLYMYSLVQKNTAASDERIVLLLGSGHVSMIEQFVKDDDRFEKVELKDILK